ncbi:Hypothetical protein FKW44_003957, partial [Caligus rogercresseyi]
KMYSQDPPPERPPDQHDKEPSPSGVRGDGDAEEKRERAAGPAEKDGLQAGRSEENGGDKKEEKKTESYSTKENIKK